MARKEQMLAGIDYDGSIIVGTEKNDYINKPCTVVIHEGKPERVFTESEVKAMASEIVEAAMAECNTVYHTDEDAEAEMSAMIRRILERHGVVLDPA